MRFRAGQMAQAIYAVPLCHRLGRPKVQPGLDLCPTGYSCYYLQSLLWGQEKFQAVRGVRSTNQTLTTTACLCLIATPELIHYRELSDRPFTPKKARRSYFFRRNAGLRCLSCECSFIQISRTPQHERSIYIYLLRYTITGLVHATSLQICARLSALTSSRQKIAGSICAKTAGSTQSAHRDISELKSSGLLAFRLATRYHGSFMCLDVLTMYLRPCPKLPNHFDS